MFSTLVFVFGTITNEGAINEKLPPTGKFPSGSLKTFLISCGRPSAPLLASLLFVVLGNNYDGGSA